MSHTSLVYRHPAIYESLMRLLYGKHYGNRYEAISQHVPQRASVLDVCCGPAVLYHRYLKKKGVDYTGVDINPHLLRALENSGGKSVRMDLSGDAPLPKADIVVMQASLYHFLPSHVDHILDKLCDAARQQVFIAEPIRNLSDSSIPFIASLAKKSANPGTGHQALRFNEATLDLALERFQASGQLRLAETIAGGREKLYIIQTNPVS